jgi:dihydroxyacetone synthase
MAPIALVDEMKDSPIHVSGGLKRINATDKKTIDLVLSQFRCLIADLCQQFNGGHPGYETGP